jgi:hypothetical protein
MLLDVQAQSAVALDVASKSISKHKADLNVSNKLCSQLQVQCKRQTEELALAKEKIATLEADFEKQTQEYKNKCTLYEKSMLEVKSLYFISLC